MDLLTNTHSEEYRHECEVRWLVSLDLTTRRKVLGLIGDARGLETQKRLQAELIELWKNK
jgi:hypothetical protein